MSDTCIQQWFSEQIVSQSEDFSPMYDQFALSDAAAFYSAAPYIVKGLDAPTFSGLNVSFNHGIARAANATSVGYPFLPAAPLGYPGYVVFDDLATRTIALPSSSDVVVFAHYDVTPVVSGQKKYTLTPVLRYSVTPDQLDMPGPRLARIKTGPSGVLSIDSTIRYRDVSTNQMAAVLRKVPTYLFTQSILFNTGPSLGYNYSFRLGTGTSFINLQTNDITCLQDTGAGWYKLSLESGCSYEWGVCYSALPTGVTFTASFTKAGSTDIFDQRVCPNFQQTPFSSTCSGAFFIEGAPSNPRFIDVVFSLLTNGVVSTPLNCKLYLFKRNYP